MEAHSEGSPCRAAGHGYQEMPGALLSWSERACANVRGLKDWPILLMVLEPGGLSWGLLVLYSCISISGSTSRIIRRAAVCRILESVWHGRTRCLQGLQVDFSAADTLQDLLVGLYWTLSWEAPCRSSESTRHVGGAAGISAAIHSAVLR